VLLLVLLAPQLGLAEDLVEVGLVVLGFAILARPLALALALTLALTSPVVFLSVDQLPISALRSGR
jgi:hypothetical protein